MFWTKRRNKLSLQRRTSCSPSRLGWVWGLVTPPKFKLLIAQLLSFPLMLSPDWGRCLLSFASLLNWTQLWMWFPNSAALYYKLCEHQDLHPTWRPGSVAVRWDWGTEFAFQSLGRHLSDRIVTVLWGLFSSHLIVIPKTKNSDSHIPKRSPKVLPLNEGLKYKKRNIVRKRSYINFTIITIIILFYY